MKHFYSLSQYPGTTGEYFYNTMFKKLSLPYTYTALKCEDIYKSVRELIKYDAAGFSVSMPFKYEIIDMLDHFDARVIRFSSCNTVLNNYDELFGYNTDCYGADYVLSQIPSNSKISILGAGSMGSMFNKLKDDAKVYSRKNDNWQQRYEISDVVINCTSFGTMSKKSPFEKLPTNISLVIDLATKNNDLEYQCRYHDIKYISGRDFYKHQFMKQFEIYTGIPITFEDIKEL